ncbi:MAG TPA: serine/threonine-protein kinase [Dehalococcoidia bacterium]|nr:serine/threonine-protein kinase [Dehalococcoidia bacterium]
MTAVRRFGRYEVLGVLGTGGFAEVLRARDPALGRDVAVKALLPHLLDQPAIVQRFAAEASAIARLRHPNIVTIYDVGEAEGRPFYAMELVQGLPLTALITAGRALAPERVLELLRGLCSAIDYLHNAGIVHRDIKPANVMLDEAGQVVLMDFGVARTLGQATITQTGFSLGTPQYMAPEQVRGDPAGPAADIYALGVLTYHLLAGRPPFVGDTAHVLHAQVYDPPPPLAGVRPDLPPALCAAVEAALAKSPDARPPSAAAFLALASGQTAAPASTLTYVPPAPPEPPTEPGVRTTPFARVPVEAPPQKRRRGPLLALGGVIALLAVIVVAAALIVSRRGGSPRPVPPPTAIAATTIEPTPTPSPAASATAVAATAAPSAIAAGGAATPAATAASVPTATTAATRAPASGSAPPATRAPSAAPPPTASPVQAVGVSADDPAVTTITVERAEGLPDGGVQLALTFAVHLSNWSADSAQDSSIYLLDEDLHRSNLIAVSGPAAQSQAGVSSVTGLYRFAPLAPGTRWVWLHYGTSVTTDQALILGFDLGAAAPAGPSRDPARPQLINRSVHNSGCCDVTAVAAEALGDGDVRLLLAFTLEPNHHWQGDGRAENAATIVVQDGAGHSYPLKGVAGPSSVDDAAALTTGGWYRFGPLPAGTQRITLHYGDAALPLDLGSAAPR